MYMIFQNRGKTTEVKLFAKPDNISGSSVSIEITKPDGKIDQERIRVTSNIINYTYTIRNDLNQLPGELDLLLGQYQISIKNVNDVLLGPISFTLRDKSEQSDEQKLVPAWIKNTAGWWASDTISDAEFLNALQFLIKENIIKVEQEENLWFGSPVEIIYRTKLAFI